MSASAVASPITARASSLAPASAPASAPPPTTTRFTRADGATWSLRLAMDQVAVALAVAASSFRREQGWTAFGFARLDDHARERFGRTGRWLRDMAALGEALARLPGLTDAMTGDDGGPPIGRVAALLVGKVATADSVAAWVALARSLTVRRLRQEVGRARKAGAEWPLTCEEAPAGRDRPSEKEDDEQETWDFIRLMVPAQVKAAFEEVLDLFRAVEGSESTVTSFVEALVTEASTGPWPAGSEGEADRRPLFRSEWTAVIEEALARSTDFWAGLSRPGGHRGVADLHTDAAHTSASKDAKTLDETMRALITREDALERQLARRLREMAEAGAWSRLEFTGAGHYAEQRLGLSRSTIRRRLWTARAVARLPVIRRAYEDGEIGLEATLHLARLAGGMALDLPTQEAWVARAREATIKRLRDEARALDRPEHRTRPGYCPAPLSDAAWHASLHREPGRTRGLVTSLGQEAAALPASDVFLRLRLPSDLADRLQGAITAARARLGQIASSVPPFPDDARWNPEIPSGSLAAARDHFVRGRRLPLWVGLLALLEEFARVWDDPESMPRRDGDRVYIRDGWRCMAPGCSSRRNLEGHHVKYRSRGGQDNVDNLVCLCRFHHQRGEHGGLARCRGVAPTGLVWRLGRRDLGVSYRNDLRT